MQPRDDCVVSIATALRTKDAKQVGTYYDNIVTSMKRHLNTNIKKESSLENLHYTMVVYWERVLLPNKIVKSKDSKGDTAKKPSQRHQQQQYRSDAGNNGSDAGALAPAEQSTGKKKTTKIDKTAASVKAPGNGTSVITPTQSICIEEEDQNQIALLPPPPTTGAAAVASSGPLPADLIKIRLVAASNVYLASMRKQKYSGAASMTLPAQTSLVDMLAHLERTWQRAMPSSSLLKNSDINPSNGENGSDVEKRCCLYLEAGSEASAALQGIRWGGPKCNLDLTIGDIVALLPTPKVDGESVTLYFSWDLSTRTDKGDDDIEMGEATVPDQQQQVQKNGGITNSRGIAPALPGEDAHDSLRRALQAAFSHAAKHKVVAGAEAAAAAAKTKAKPNPAPVRPRQPNTVSLNTKVPLKSTSIGKKRERTESETELKNALSSGLDVDGTVDAMEIEHQQEQQPQPHSEALENGDERPAQRARVPVGLRNLLTVQPPGIAGAAPPAKTKAKKSPKKKAASARRKKVRVAPQPSSVFQSAPQVQQQQQHMHNVVSQQQPAAALLDGMPLPAGMINYLPWAGGFDAKAAHVLQAQQQLMGPYTQFGMQQQQQHPQLYTQVQQQQMPSAIAQPPQAPPQFDQGLTDGMNSFGDSIFKSLFETSLPDYPQQQPQQEQQQQQVAAAVPKEIENEAIPVSAPTAGTGVGFIGAFNTPGKEPRTSPRTEEEAKVSADGIAGAGAGNEGNNTISNLPIDWACLSPPPNFKLPPDFGGSPGGRSCGFDGASLLGSSGHSFLPSTSLLGFMDAHPKAQGAAATAVQKGVEALFQQVGGVAGGVVGGVGDETLAADTAAGRRAPPTDTSLHSIDSLLNKSNSNWLAPFATAQGTATNTAGNGGVIARNGVKKKSGGGKGEQEDLPPVCDRPFAALFGI